MNQQRLRRREISLTVPRFYKWNAFADDALLQLPGFVETEQFVVIVHEQVEVSQKVLPQDSTNAGVRALYLGEIVGDDQRFLNCVRIDGQAVEATSIEAWSAWVTATTPMEACGFPGSVPRRVQGQPW